MLMVPPPPDPEAVWRDTAPPSPRMRGTHHDPGRDDSQNLYPV